MNSSGTYLAKLNGGKPYNPAYLHPDVLEALGLLSGDLVTVTSPHDYIPSVAEADDTLRRDVVAMHHAFGGLPSEDDEVRERGSNVESWSPPPSNTTRSPDSPAKQHPGQRHLTHRLKYVSATFTRLYSAVAEQL